MATVNSVINGFTKIKKQLENISKKCDIAISQHNAAIQNLQNKLGDVELEKGRAERIAAKLDDLLK